MPCPPRLMLLKGSLQGKDPAKYAQEESYKEKTSAPRKRYQPSTTIKAPIPSLAKVHIIHPSLAL